MRIHVTGANGRVGQEVVKALSQLGEVHGTDVDNMDVTNLESVIKVLAKSPPDAMVHLAGLKGNQAGQDRPMDFFRVNTLGTANVLEACRQVGVKKFLYFSTLVAHGPGEAPLVETSPLTPIHPYSGTKAASEPLVQAYVGAYGMSGVIFRPSFIVGPIAPPHPYVDNLIYDFIEAIHDSGVIELMGDGHYQREWLHPKDVASAVALAIAAQITGCETFHIVGERVTMQELATRIIQQVGAGRVNMNPDRPGFSVTSCSEKARRQLGWQPEVDLDTLIAEIWDEYQTRA